VREGDADDVRTGGAKNWWQGSCRAGMVRLCAEQGDENRKTRGRLAMVDPTLPPDLVALLQRGKQPNYDPAICEAGTVTFLPLDQLKVEFFPIDPHGSDDPHTGEHGSYLVAGVSLLASCEGYDPVGILLWLPLDGCYGTWDGEHRTLRAFHKEVDWSAIAMDPAHYINSQWGLGGSAPVFDFVPWSRHPYNSEQLHHPLPDIPEWYEVKWLRRGVYRNGVQLRYPEELQIRIERGGKGCEVTVRTKKAEKGAELSRPQNVSLGADALERIGPQIESGFWTQPTTAPGGPGGESATYWTISGFRAGKYHKLARFYEEDHHKGDPVHELGKELARLAKLKHFAADD
jgi:hypothetical protein